MYNLGQLGVIKSHNLSFVEEHLFFLVDSYSKAKKIMKELDM